MANTQTGNIQAMRNLANALRDQHRQLGSEPKLPAPTDQDILRAMLGKPFKTASIATTETAPARKAG